MEENLIDYTSERQIKLFYLSVERGKMGLELLSWVFARPKEYAIS